MIQPCDYRQVDLNGRHEMYCPVSGFMMGQGSNSSVRYTPHSFPREMNNNHTHHFCLDTAVVPDDNPELEAVEIFAYCECGMQLKDKDIVKALDAYINTGLAGWYDRAKRLDDEYDRTSRDMRQQEWEMMTLGAWEE